MTQLTNPEEVLAGAQLDAYVWERFKLRRRRDPALFRWETDAEFRARVKRVTGGK